MFKKIFGTKKKEVQPTTQEAIQKIRESEEILGKKQDLLEKKIEAEIALAKQHGMKNKRAAMQALKRKNLYMKELEKIDGTLCTLDFQRQALENASTNSHIIQVLSGGAKALKKAHNNMDVDQVHELLEDIAEQNEISKEISDAISNPIGLRNDIDENELLAELEELEQEELEKELTSTKDILDSKLPPVPSHELKTVTSKNKESQNDLDDLKAWAES
uniref:Charged multivesicular body protein 4b n=1 Tax=Parastrongyloides trichosuri TaxID=131310 RepID=A0A0N5A1X9_PARTI